MNSAAFPDLEGIFEPADVISGQLSESDFAQKIIAEQQLRKTHWRISFRHVQYGTYQASPACLLVVDGKFHPEDRKRHRFTWARVKIGFSSDQNPVEVLKIVPERAYGITVPEQHNSTWALRSKASLAMPGVPITVDLWDVQLGHRKTYSIDRTASMQGSERGMPYAKEAVWTLEEANQEGIPWKIPSLVVLLKYTPGTRFQAKFSIDAKVGFSMNPMRWPIFAESPKPVLFDEKMQLILPGEERESDFTTLDLATLTKLDFSDDK